MDEQTPLEPPQTYRMPGRPAAGAVIRRANSFLIHAFCLLIDKSMAPRVETAASTWDHHRRLGACGSGAGGRRAPAKIGRQIGLRRRRRRRRWGHRDSTKSVNQ